MNSIDRRKLTALRALVEMGYNSSDFVHHEWYVRDHLSIVHTISKQIAVNYAHVNELVLELIVWLHDYGKVFNINDAYEATLVHSRELLIRVGFGEEFTDEIIYMLDIFDKKIKLKSKLTPVEVKIVSTADAAAHLLSPFFFIYWKENNQKTVDELVEENLNKLEIDWNQKMVLPDVKRKLRTRYLSIKKSLESKNIVL